jgi:hypothetical protein
MAHGWTESANPSKPREFEAKPVNAGNEVRIPLLAHSGHRNRNGGCPLSGSRRRRVKAPITVRPHSLVSPQHGGDAYCAFGACACALSCAGAADLVFETAPGVAEALALFAFGSGCADSVLR